MSKGKALIGVAAVVAIGGGVARQVGDVDLQAPRYVDPEGQVSYRSPIGFSFDEGPKEDFTAPGTLPAEQLAQLEQHVKGLPGPLCPENVQDYGFYLGDERTPSGLICLDTVNVSAVPETSQLVFPLAVRGSAADVGVTLDQAGTPEDDLCAEAMSRMTAYGQFVIEGSGLVPADQTVGVLIDGGQTCTTYVRPPAPNTAGPTRTPE